MTRALRTKYRAALAAGLVLALAQTAPFAHAAASDGITPEQAYQLAREARTERNYPAMLAMLRLAGDAGELRAQELLAGVLLAGPALYGPAIAADPCEAELWAWRAAAQGSQVARRYEELLNGMREMPGGRVACASRIR